MSCKRSFGFFPLFGRTSRYSFSISGHVLKKTTRQRDATFYQSPEPSSPKFIRNENVPQKFLDEHFAKETGAAGDENGSIRVHFTHSVFINVVHRVIIIRCHSELCAKL